LTLSLKNQSIKERRTIINEKLELVENEYALLRGFIFRCIFYYFFEDKLDSRKIVADMKGKELAEGFFFLFSFIFFFYSRSFFFLSLFYTRKRS
jgi:hypothetical protein